MKKSKLSAILCTVSALVLVCLMVFTGCKTSVDKEYEYNNTIETNANAPVSGEADVTAIEGYVEDTEQKFVTLPYAIKDTDLVVTSIGKYSGEYPGSATDDSAKEVFAIVVENNSDKVVSYSSFTIEYSDDKVCDFSPTNLPAHQSAVVFSNGESVAYSDVKSFECTDSMAVMAAELPLLKDVVGIDFNDGQFIVTNLTSESLGDVYIRYKNFTSGNAYLGGVTHSVMVSDVQPYETYMVDAKDYTEDNSVIIAVENLKQD